MAEPEYATGRRSAALGTIPAAVMLAALIGCQAPDRTGSVASSTDSHSKPVRTVSGPAETPAAPQTKTAAGDPLLPRVAIATSFGNIIVELNGKEAPEAVLDFLQLVKEGFYDGTVFHRVLSEVLIQGGAYTPDMERKITTTPPVMPIPVREMKLPNEKFSMALILGNAPSGARDTEFYINVTDNLGLDDPEHRGRFVVFGKVVDGFFALNKIRLTPVGPHPKYAEGRSAVVPVKPVVIRSIRPLTAVDEEAIRKHAEERKEARENRLENLVRSLEKKAGRKAVRTDSGLIYVDMRIGTGDRPFPSDTVQFNYHGTLLDGTVFESTRWSGPVRRRVDSLVTGLREGMLTMREGGLRVMILPPHLGFPEGIPGRIPPNSTIVFEIELLGIGEEDPGSASP